ncbi:MAG TPA: cytochrome c-type biogenesis CcmF C-terminal domain-containing protein, partial [Gaiellaceae bacterium]|nr:cytochrome c-type biogenesis CcmF C-terminal domain-containing protein [Gaiellaceae bacterium]
LGFVIVTTIFSVSLIIWRLPLLRARTKLESAFSREAVFLYNNLLLVALALTILWGVIFPVLTQLVENQSRTMSRPYYDFFLRSFGLPLLFLMGVGPLIAWRRTSIRALVRTLRWPLGVAFVTGIALIADGAGSSVPGLIAYTFSAFVLATIVVELVRGTRVTGSLFQLVSRNRRRYGGYIVHAAIVLLAIGIAGSSSYGTTTEKKIAVGQSMTIDGYTLTNMGARTSNGPDYSAITSNLRLSGNAQGTLTSGINDFGNQGPAHDVGIHTNWARAEDLYVIANQINSDGSVYLKVLVKPLINLIWIAGFIFVFGSLVALWPDAREQKRLISRFALAKA